MSPPIEQSKEPVDLLRYEAQTQALYRALVQYQQARGALHPADCGLAVFHQVQLINGEPHLEGSLVHVDGGILTSGPVPFADRIAEVLHSLRWLLLGDHASPQPQDAPPAPAPVVETPAAEPPAPEPTPAPEPAPTSFLVPSVSHDEPPSSTVERVLSLLDELHGRDPAALKTLATAYREAFLIGRTPLVKSITTMERADWLIEQLTPLLTDEP
jgi:hypothetical protein